jgi:hypothetical protein
VERGLEKQCEITCVACGHVNMSLFCLLETLSGQTLIPFGGQHALDSGEYSFYALAWELNKDFSSHNFYYSSFKSFFLM